MYVKREIEDTVSAYLRQFKVVLVTGARQVGKTTMLRHTLPDAYGYVALDDLDLLGRVHSDSALFFQDNKPPLLIDEIQYAPDLFMRIKHIVDRSDEKGAIVLTGSQTYRLMQGVSESLAGRIGILEMSSLSLRELVGNLKHTPYVPAPAEADNRKELLSDFDLWAHIHRGSMPELIDETIEWQAYYSSYVRTYIERDVRELVNIRNEHAFFDFMVACASRTGQLLNMSDIANTVNVEVATVRDWLSVLEASGIVHILRPFWANTSKRLAKTPKLFFMDTGLACYLTAWNTPETLKRGAMAGHMFETFAVSEVLKSFINAGQDTRQVSFYRDGRKREIDLVIQDGHVLHPVEIKMATNPDKSAIANFNALEGVADYEVGFGSVICQAPSPYHITPQVQAISVFDI